MEKNHLPLQLQHYEHGVPLHLVLEKVTAIVELCRGLVETRKICILCFIDLKKVTSIAELCIGLVLLIISVLATTTKHAF